MFTIQKLTGVLANQLIQFARKVHASRESSYQKMSKLLQ
jgi:hypothetical protein